MEAVAAPPEGALFDPAPPIFSMDSFRNSTDRMRTGIAGLDHILEGGLVRGDSLLLEGPPGSAKTTFGVRIIHEGIAQFDEPGLIITFEEFPKQIYQESASYGLDLAALEAQGKLRVIWTSPARILEGFTGKNDLIDRIVTKMNIRRLMIDSVTHFKRVADSELKLREALGRILSYLKIRDINAILVKEIQDLSEERIAFEEYLVDASIRLFSATSAVGGENQRSLEIRKTRGQNHISGRHPFKLRGSGPVVFPHLRIVDLENLLGPDHAAGPDRVSIGSPEIDRMLGGGLLSRSTTLLGGPAGSGKSVLSAMFLNAGTRLGERGLLIRLKPEAPKAAPARDPAGDQIDVLGIEPLGSSVDETMQAITAKIARTRPDRIVLDSFDDLLELTRSPEAARDLIRILFRTFRKSGATGIILNEAGASILADGRGEERRLAYLADTVVHLSIIERGDKIQRRMAITKHGGSHHAMDIIPFDIDDGGFRLP